MRTPMLVLAALALATPVAGQGGHAHGGAEITGGGQLPPGWHARRDKKAADQELDNVKFVAMGPGFHVTMGGTNATFWNPANVAQGEFEAGATFNQTKANPMHPEGYGLVFNGAQLDAKQAQLDALSAGVAGVPLEARPLEPLRQQHFAIGALLLAHGCQR